MTLQPWEPNMEARVVRHMGKTAAELNLSANAERCPAFLLLSDGNFLAVGRRLTEAFKARLPEDVLIAENEEGVILPRELVLSLTGELVAMLLEDRPPTASPPPPA